MNIWRDALYSLKHSRIVENIGIIRTALAPIRLSRWQLTKLFLAQIWRDAGLWTRILSVLLIVTVSAMILDRLIGATSLEALGIPIGGSSKGTKVNFQQMLEHCKSKVCKSAS